MISVIIPVYKVERYIKGCIQSILNQDCKEFEIILVNDGTPDNSALIAEDLLSSQNKIEYRVINTPNRGVSAARNMGLKNARGDFVIMVDADDVISPCFLEDMLQMSHDYPMNDIYSSSFSIVDDSAAQCFDVSNENNAVKEYTAEEAIMVYRSRKVKFLLPTLMLRKEFLENNLISFDERVRYSEDVQFIWRCLFYNKKPVIHSNKKNYNYILHDNSTMTSSGVDKILTGFMGLKELNAEVREVVDNTLLDGIVCQMCFSLLHGSAKMLIFKDFRTLYKKAGCRQELKKTKDSDCRCKIVTAILKINLFSGYYIMRFL